MEKKKRRHKGGSLNRATRELSKRCNKACRDFEFFSEDLMATIDYRK